MNFFAFFIVFCVIYYFIWSFSLFYIFPKAYINKWKALIPFVNIYEFVKLCRIDWYWGFVPVVNLIFFIVSPYLIGYEFSQKKHIKILGVLFPLWFFPYIAFSKASYIHKQLPKMNLNSIEDIDRLEKKIINANNNNQYTTIIDSTFADNTDSKEHADTSTSNYYDALNKLEHSNDIAKLENTIVEDVYDIPVISNKTSSSESKNGNYGNFFEEADTMDNYIADIENKIQNNNKVQNSDTAEYKEIETEKLSNEELAFSNKKAQDLVCPRCGSSLIGATNHCPGCGANIKEIFTK